MYFLFHSNFFAWWPKLGIQTREKLDFLLKILFVEPSPKPIKTWSKTWSEEKSIYSAMGVKPRAGSSARLRAGILHRQICSKYTLPNILEILVIQYIKVCSRNTILLPASYCLSVSLSVSHIFKKSHPSI